MLVKPCGVQAARILIYLLSFWLQEVTISGNHHFIVLFDSKRKVSTSLGSIWIDWPWLPEATVSRITINNIFASQNPEYQEWNILLRALSLRWAFLNTYCWDGVMWYRLFPICLNKYWGLGDVISPPPFLDHLNKDLGWGDVTSHPHPDHMNKHLGWGDVTWPPLPLVQVFGMGWCDIF